MTSIKLKVNRRIEKFGAGTIDQFEKDFKANLKLNEEGKKKKKRDDKKKYRSISLDQVEADDNLEAYHNYTAQTIGLFYLVLSTDNSQ